MHRSRTESAPLTPLAIALTLTLCLVPSAHLAAEAPARLVLKLTDDAAVEARGGRLEAMAIPPATRHAVDLSHLRRLLDGQDLRVEQLFSPPRQVLDAVRRLGEQRSGQLLADLSQFYLVASSEGIGSLPALLEPLRLLPEVESAYLMPTPRTPADLPPTTPDFQSTVGPGQGYRDPAPVGLGVDLVWSRGYKGWRSVIVDVEQSWNLSHEDLDHLGSAPLVPPSDWGNTGTSATDHGTATLGVLAAGDNGYGVTGMTRSVIRVVPLSRQSDPFWTGPDAILLATLTAQPGSILLVEAEIPISASAALPFELFDAEFAVLRQAVALGLHVIEPAGNSSGGIDLDFSPLVTAPGGGSLFDLLLRDSGAVMVGGGESTLWVHPFYGNTTPWHGRYPNSNYGSRIDSYAWGQNVVTTGYGPASSSLAFCANPADPFPLSPADPNQYYTSCYNGTSSAAAQVAGAAAILAQKHRSKYGQPMGTREMRNLLRMGTDSPHGIGRQPNLPFQIDLMERGGLIRHLFQAEPRSPSETYGYGTHLGESLAGLGDLDGDGINDVAVGAPSFEVAPGPLGTQVNFGRVYVYSGGGGELLYKLDGGNPGDYLGSAVAGVDDLDGDGVDDLVAGAFAATPDYGGYVRVYSGATGTELYMLPGAANEELGASLAGVGDLDGDGAGDFLAGAPSAGRAYLFSGAGGSVLATFVGPGGPFSEFGRAVAAAGDVDGDGTGDLLIGSPLEGPSGALLPGKARVYSGADFRLLLTLSMPPADEAAAPFARFGDAVDGVGDVDRDGLDDLIIGAPEWRNPGKYNAGKAFLFSATGALLDSFQSIQPYARRGASVAGVGDFDGDGYRDVAVGQPGDYDGTVTGRVFVFLGPFPRPTPKPKPATFWTKELATRFGSSLAAVGDLNGDGRDDLLLGERWGNFEQGRAYVVTHDPAPDPFADRPRLVADPPLLEAADTDGDGFSGGGTSPESVTFHLDAGPAWAGAGYQVVGPLAAYLANPTGTLDGQGETDLPLLGPIPEAVLCPSQVGQLFTYTAVVTDAGGSTTASNPVEVAIVNEVGGC